MADVAGAMTAREFIKKWGPGGPAYKLSERAGAQPHFMDLCHLLGVPTPGDAERYCFERGVTRTGTGSGRTDGFADVWLKGAFALEYKAPGKSLDAALKQLMMYALPLESPPLLIVSDRLRIEVHTHFTGTPSEVHVFKLEDLADLVVQQKLRRVWTHPETFKPQKTNRQITELAASTFAGTAERLRLSGVAPDVASHFLTQCVFCFFAEDVGLLPGRLFERLVGIKVDPAKLQTQLLALFNTMRDGGLFGVDDVPWFNGGLFQRIEIPPLTVVDVDALKAASALDWTAIDPSILGTLFERGLDPAQRAQLGANFTDPDTIMRIVEPVVKRPLLAEWSTVRATIESALARRDELRTEAAAIPSMTKALKDKFARVRTKANDEEKAAQQAFAAFLERLSAYRVLDPACGSGNFLYLALKCLKDIEHLVNLQAEELGLARQQDVTGPHNVLGIEINGYAAELARITVWIGELQWRLQHGYAFKLNPVLDPLDTIECRDAVLAADGTAAIWPAADALTGNPPFVGNKKMRSELGDAYVESLRAAYVGVVSGGADLVCYWFEKARGLVEEGRLQRAGLVSTNSIRGGANREVLERIVSSTKIFEAWSDEPWVNKGAAVRVSLVGFGHSGQATRLDGKLVYAVSADLQPLDTSGGLDDLTQAKRLSGNESCCFQGAKFVGAFDVPADLAHAWLKLPANPGEAANHRVVRQWINGMDVTRRRVTRWIIDFGTDISEEDACLYEAPFEHIAKSVKAERILNREGPAAQRWWIHQRPRPEMRHASKNLTRFIVTPEVSKHRVFVFAHRALLPSGSVYLIPRADDTTFGILHSRMHELWSLRMCTWLGKGNDPRYTPTTCFETFPFPYGLTPADTADQHTEALATGEQIPADLDAAVRPHAEAIAIAAARLVNLRDAWLNPPEWTERVPEVVPAGMAVSPYPDRIVAKPGFERQLADRTLTKLYNEPKAWLVHAHRVLDDRVAAAYGWTDYTPEMSEDEILRRLLALNAKRAGSTVRTTGRQSGDVVPENPT